MNTPPEFFFVTHWVLVTRLEAVEVHCNHHSPDLIYCLDLFLEQHEVCVFCFFFNFVILQYHFLSSSADFQPLSRMLAALRLELLLDWTDSSSTVPTKYLLVRTLPNFIIQSAKCFGRLIPRAARKHS